MMSAKVSVALYQLGFDPNSRHSIKRAFSILDSDEECEKFLSIAAPDSPRKNIQYEVDKLLREHNNMPMLTRSEFSGTSTKEKKMAKATATAKKKTPVKAGKVITLIGLEKSGHKRGFNEGSQIAKCFELITDGMTVDDYIKAAGKKRIVKAKAAGSLSKLSLYGIVSVAA
jgi:hypothetical protein